MIDVVGRDEELAALRAFVAEGGEGLACLVLEGEAGIGKSTLWRAGVCCSFHQRERGCSTSLSVGYRSAV